MLCLLYHWVFLRQCTEQGFIKMNLCQKKNYFHNCQVSQCVIRNLSHLLTTLLLGNRNLSWSVETVLTNQLLCLHMHWSNVAISLRKLCVLKVFQRYYVVRNTSRNLSALTAGLFRLWYDQNRGSLQELNISLVWLSLMPRRQRCLSPFYPTQKILGGGQKSFYNHFQVLCHIQVISQLHYTPIH